MQGKEIFDGGGYCAGGLSGGDFERQRWLGCCSLQGEFDGFDGGGGGFGGRVSWGEWVCEEGLNVHSKRMEGGNKGAF